MSGQAHTSRPVEMRNGAVNPKIRPPSCGTMRTPSKQGSLKPVTSLSSSSPSAQSTRRPATGCLSTPVWAALFSGASATQPCLIRGSTSNYRTRQHVRGRVCLQERGAGALQSDTVNATCEDGNAGSCGGGGFRLRLLQYCPWSHLAVLPRDPGRFIHWRAGCENENLTTSCWRP